MSIAPLNREFLLKELEQVRKNYDGYVEETRRLERYIIVLIGATWSWCASNQASLAFNLLVWFPAAASFLFGIRAAAIHFQLRAAIRYIAKAEGMLDLPGGLGWATAEVQQSKGVPALVAITAYVFWAVISIGTIVIPLMFHLHAATPKGVAELSMPPVRSIT